jgi:tRNA-2-methylthio-N6-dimethylallyladenosine synthase
MTPKTFKIKSFGCQMNVYDGERIAELLSDRGLAAAGDGEDADLVILNTCHIREKAAEKVYSELGRLRLLKEERARQGRRMLVAVAGCVAQAQGEEILDRAACVDIVFGPQTYHRLADMVARVERDAGARLIDTAFPAEDKFDFLPEEARPQGVTAFLTIQEGCDKFCTYCVVPYTRWSEISRPQRDIIAEAHALVDGGAREIVLLGQNVNAWAHDGSGFADLIRALAKIDGLERIRYTTSHPADMKDELIAAHAKVDKLMPYLHLPVQSGSDRILKAMNRSHTTETYLATIEKMRSARPDIALSGDFIVGFPGETDEDFEATLKIVDAVRYAAAYSFKYSARPGTPAATMEDQIPREIMDDRLRRLQAKITENQLAFNRSKIGVDTQILIERKGRHDGQMIGRSPWLQSVHVETDARPGELLDVTLVAAGPNSMTGAVLAKVAA